MEAAQTARNSSVAMNALMVAVFAAFLPRPATWKSTSARTNPVADGVVCKRTAGLLIWQSKMPALCVLTTRHQGMKRNKSLTRCTIADVCEHAHLGLPPRAHHGVALWNHALDATGRSGKASPECTCRGNLWIWATSCSKSARTRRVPGPGNAAVAACARTHVKFSPTRPRVSDSDAVAQCKSVEEPVMRGEYRTRCGDARTHV